ncbi:MAG: beta-ketoacyl-ACP synthase III [Planctomycetota bacterium]
MSTSDSTTKQPVPPPLARGVHAASNGAVHNAVRELPSQAAILGLGHALPAGRLTNDDLALRIETNHEWIMSRVGIASRCVAAPDQATSDLAVLASQKALADAQVTPGEIDLVLCATSTPDTLLPSTACHIQRKLGASQAAAMDLNAVCSGFVYGLHTASAFLKSGMHRNILLVGADTLSKFLDYQDRSSCILFGDGAGAAVLSASGRFEVVYSAIGSDGRQAGLIEIPAGGSREPASVEAIESRRQFVRMEGREVYRMAVRHMVQAAEDALAATGLDVSDINLVVPHQANVRIIESVRKAFGIASEKVVTDLKDVGNTSAASIPAALCRSKQFQALEAGQHVMLLSFGSGVTWGSQILRCACATSSNGSASHG